MKTRLSGLAQAARQRPMASAVAGVVACLIVVALVCWVGTNLLLGIFKPDEAAAPTPDPSAVISELLRDYEDSPDEAG